MKKLANSHSQNLATKKKQEQLEKYFMSQHILGFRRAKYYNFFEGVLERNHHAGLEKFQ